MHAADGVKVIRGCRPDLGGGTIGQQREDAGHLGHAGAAAGSAAAPAGSGGSIRAYGPGDTSAMCPLLSHLITYGGDPFAFGSPITRPVRSVSPSGTSRSPI
jgi:hypothetical protein